MATEISVAGRRLLEERNRRRLTAEDLAARVPDGALSKTVITNIESGRKKDMSVTELMQVVTALDMSPLDFLAPAGDPYAPLDYPSLPRAYSGMCLAEYRAIVDVGPLGPGWRRSRWGRAVKLFRDLRSLERSLHRHEVLESHANELAEFFLREPDATVTIDDVHVTRSQIEDEAWMWRVDGIRSSSEGLRAILEETDVDLLDEIPAAVRARAYGAVQLAKDVVRQAEDDLAVGMRGFDAAAADSAE